MIYNFGVSDVSMMGENKKYYMKWCNMIERCYSPKKKGAYPTYSDCTVCEEWKYFSNFLGWCKRYEVVCSIDCKDFALDKDLKGCNIYSPETCCFLPKNVNTFLTIKRRNNTLKYVGVSFQKYTGLYKAEINDFFNGKRVCIGYYKTPEEAARAYTSAKLVIAKEIEDKGIISYDVSLKGKLTSKIKDLLQNQL